jgi:tetratricopeptide (TPR) repeat protein
MRRCRVFLIAVTFWLIGLMPLRAGIYLRGDKLQPAASPSQLNDFWRQLQFLRGYGPTDVALGGKPTQHRLDFLAKVEKLKRQGKLSPADQADLGGYLLYLKQTTPQHPPFEEAVTVLEAGYRADPRHFALAANLGTAYQLTGRLDAAERCLDAAVELADPAQRPLEQLHLTLVRRRMRENFSRGQYPDLDLLFGRPAAPFRFVGNQGVWNYGQLAAAEIDKLPGRSAEQATQQIQQLLVWLPDDGRLIWQLGEWALVLHQRKTAAMLLDQAVNAFRLSHPALKLHRSLLQEATHWLNLLELLGSKQRGEAWIVQSMGESLSLGIPGAALGTSTNWMAASVPQRTSAQDLLASVFKENDSAPATAAPQGIPFVMQPWHWALVVLGGLAGFALIVWQVQQFVKPVGRSGSFR